MCMFIVMLVTTTSFTAQENIQTFSREEIVAACAAALGGKENIEAFKTLTFDYCSHAGGPILFSVVPFSVNMIASGEGQEDTSTIAFVSNRDGNREIYLMSSDGSHQKRLTSTPKDEQAPVWSPDGSRFAYLLRQDQKNFDLWLIDADGTAAEPLVAGPANDVACSWSPDGQSLAFSSNRDGDLEIYTVNVMDGQITQLTENTGIIDERPNWSPDGKYITFTTDRDGNWEIYRMLTSSPAGRLMAAGLPSCPIETETATSTSWMRTEAMSLD
jgi:dipeptidyl aminopeptidase/acylaminoacyl peptidase